jgi:TANFOR domain-containing protein
MFTLFEKVSALKAFLTIRQIILVFITLLFPFSVMGQFAPVRINIAVSPPYSTKISDYTSNPNKVLVTLQNFTADGVTLRVYLRGEITGASGTRVYTSPNYRPHMPITLQPGVPFMLSLNNIQDVFSANQLVYEGITENEILYGNGLPEDDYIICLQAYDYDNDMLLSDDAPYGCTVPFTVGNIEPPIITHPWCHEQINPVVPQNIVITWTRPAGAPPATQFRLKMVEVSPPGHDINDAINSAAQPIFFETVVSANVFLYGPSQPALVPGKTYAFMVTAFDPTGQLAFRNGGQSEVCSFIYGTESTFTPPPFADFTPTGNFLPDNFELAPPTEISGKLMVKYPTNPHEPFDFGAMPDLPGFGPISLPGGSTPAGTMPSGSGQSSNFIHNSGVTFNYGALNMMGVHLSNNINNHAVINGALVPDPDELGAHGDLFRLGWPLLSPMRAKRYLFEDTESFTHIKPLPNMRVRLVARIAYLSLDKPFGTGFPEYGGTAPIIKGIDLNGKFRGDAPKYANVTIAETTTDESGNFTFSFNLPFWTGPILTQQLDHGPHAVADQNPLADIFGAVVFPGVDIQNIQTGMQGLPGNAVTAPPQQQVMSLDGALMTESQLGYLSLKIEVVNQKFASPDIDIFAMPGDMLQIPPQITKLKTYNLKVQVNTDDTPDQIKAKNNPLEGVQVSILRDGGRVKNEVPLIIDYEGHQLDSKTFINHKEYKDIAIDTTRLNGQVVFHNLVRHAYINPQYRIELSTRDFGLVDAAYDNTFFNYEDRFENLPDVSAIQNYFGMVTYNHQFPGPEEVFLTYEMKPLPPEIKGRVMALSNLENVGIPNIPVFLLNQPTDTRIPNFTSFLNNCYSNKEASVVTNDAGFFRFTNLPVRNNNQQFIYRRIYVQPQLYQKRIFPPIGSNTSAGDKPYKLLWGELVDLKDINLQPAWMMPGYVEDEDGKPVVAYVKSGESPYYKTERVVISFNPVNPSESIVREEFKVPADPQGVAVLNVVPLSTQYFPLDTTFLPPGGHAKIMVYRRLHRPVVTVKNQQGQPVQGAIVNIGGHEATTNAQGKAQMSFAAAADQFVLRITPPAGYAPLQEPVEIPVTPHWNNLPVYTLKTAKSIQGHVTIAQTNEPLEGALVFAELVNTDGMPLYIEASTNAQGYYLLSGIPRNLNHIVVQVIKQGSNPSYIGTSKTINFPNQLILAPLTQNFTIQRLDNWDLSSIWGFPVAVTSFTEKIFPGNTYPTVILSGYFVSPATTDAFSLMQSDLKIPFKSLYVDKNQNNRPEPLQETITTEVLEIPLRVGQHYTGNLYNYVKPVGGTSYHWMFGFGKKKIEINKVSFGLGGGRIQGQVKLDLASFEIAQQFTGQLYIGMDTLSGKATAFASRAVNIPGLKYSVFSLNNNLKPVPVRNYKVFNFNASANLSHSFLENGIIRMQTILHTQIPGGGQNQTLDLKIQAGDLVINNTEISFEETPGGQLTFDLDKWKVSTTKPWRFDINEDAIVLNEVLIITGRGIDARVKNMRVRPNTLSEGQIDLQGGLTLGGIANLELSGTLEPVFNYDAGVGHYRISLVGSTDAPAGIVRNLQQTEPSQLSFESIGMLSNNTEALTLNQPLRFYNIMDMNVQGIMTGPGFFSLKGRPELGIPGFDPPNAIVSYRKVNNRIVPKVQPLQGTVYALGNVDFILDQDTLRQEVRKNLFTSYGRVIIHPAPEDLPANQSASGVFWKKQTINVRLKS